VERDERRAQAGHVSPEMTGAEDLDRWGHWDRHPDYGAIWYPSTVAVGWAPYRYGRWVWVRPWGWTWVDDARWGFAPFHYGRWVYWRNRWCWAPGTYVHRPVYAPAMVAWVGGPHFSVSVNVGGPTVGWVPLAPREVYVPYYRVSPVYIDRVNVNPRFTTPGQHPPPARHHPQTIPTGPIAYTNQGVPGAVTVVPRDVLVRREPVARAVVQVPEVHRAPITAVAPPPRVAEGPAQPQTAPATAPATPPAIGTVTAPPPRRVPEGEDIPNRGRRDGRGQDRRDDRDDRRDGRSGAQPAVPPVQAAPAAQPPVVVTPAQVVPPAPVPRPPKQPAHVQAPSTPAPVAPPTVHSMPGQVVPPRAAGVPMPAPQAPQGAAPVVRAPQAAPPRPERGDDDRKRPQPQGRQGEREREAAR
jgi:hypothetical protein